MRRDRIGRLLVVVCVAISAGLLASRGQADEGGKSSRPASPTLPQVPEGYLLVEDDVWFQLADEPDRHFLEARRDYLRDKPVEAAAAILKATAVLKLATAHAQGDAKKPLQASILELETLAAKLAHDNVHAAKSLDRIFGRSFVALAYYNEAEARRHLQGEEPEKAARHLRASSRDVMHAAVWRGTELEDNILHALGDLEKAASRLMSQEAKNFTDGVKSLEVIHDYLEKLQALEKAAE